MPKAGRLQVPELMDDVQGGGAGGANAEVALPKSRLLAKVIARVETLKSCYNTLRGRPLSKAVRAPCMCQVAFYKKRSPVEDRTAAAVSGFFLATSMGNVGETGSPLGWAMLWPESISASTVMRRMPMIKTTVKPPLERPAVKHTGAIEAHAAIWITPHEIPAKCL